MKFLVIMFGLLAYAASPAYARTAECSDGSTSNSANFQGTCSHHGGVAVWNDEKMRDQANQWCDENPYLCECSHWAGIEGHGNHPEKIDTSYPNGFSRMTYREFASELAHQERCKGLDSPDDAAGARGGASLPRVAPVGDPRETVSPQ